MSGIRFDPSTVHNSLVPSPRIGINSQVRKCPLFGLTPFEFPSFYLLLRGQIRKDVCTQNKFCELNILYLQMSPEKAILNFFGNPENVVLKEHRQL